ncbi:MAG: PQQ-binding-like beta-propeller repeat protein [Sedimentisphaerales bacterium]|jgi:outer membrane protein assembly factor BamB
MKRVIVIAAVLLQISCAFGAVLSVPGDYTTIQSAINAASPGDTVLISPGTYSGDGNYNITFSGKAVTVSSIDPNDAGIVESTVIDCNWLGGGFAINSSVVLDGLTITHGNYSMGGGISVSGTNISPLIRNCNIMDNNAANYGGGFYCSGSSTTVTIIDSNISGNSSANLGGGIYCSSGVAVVINNCKIMNNQAVRGGGLYVYSLTADRLLIAGNIASGTTSANGGGIYAFSGTVNINNSILAGNFAQVNGGGVYKNTSAIVTMSNCTLAGNAASGLGGGIYLGNAAFSAVNSIFWGNKDSTGITTSAQINPTSSSPGQTLLFCCIQDPLSYFGDANNGNVNDDPMFVREPNDGGDGWGVGNNDDYGDLHLRPGSPCIDACNKLYRPGPNEVDLDGQPRLMGSAVDMGAYEYGKIIVVTKPAGGEIWATSSKHPIMWNKYGVGSVDIRFSSDNGNTWETIASAIADVNSYIWQLPGDIESNQCVISIVPDNGDANVVSLPSGPFTVNWYPSRPAVPPEWLRRGLLPAPNSSENKGPRIGCVKWVFETDGPVSSQVAVSRPYWDSYWIYIGSEDGNIYALDDLGELNWICDINTAVVGSPAVGYYWMVYVAGQNGWLYAIDDYGDISWTHKTAGPIYSTPVVGYDGKIYICSEDGLIYALDADGSELWTFKTGASAKLNGTILATPVIDKNGTVYIGGLYEPNLYALDANSGSVKWVCNFGAVEPNKGQIVTSPAIGPDGTIYQTLVRDPNLYAVDPCTGNILWSAQLRPDPCYSCAPGSGQCCSIIDLYLTYLHSHKTITPALLQQYESCNEGRWQGIAATGWINYTTSSGWSSPVVGSDGTIYVSFDDPYLRAVEPNGTTKWITRLGLIGGFTLTIDKNGLIYAASDDNFVCVVDPNGQEVSRFQGKGWVSFPTIAEDGTIIVSDANNMVWAITSNSCSGQSPVLHIPADLRANNIVDFADFAVLGQSWRDCTDPFDPTFCASGISKYGYYAPGDVDRDAYINLWDLNALVEEWLTQSDFE